MVFLAGVGRATLLDGDRLVATANTLIDSSITIGVSFEDIRAGAGNKLYGRYAHTSTFDLKLTDAMFDLQYIAMNTGSDVSIGGDVILDEELTSDADKKITLSKTAVPFFSNEDTYAYAKKSGSDAAYLAYAVDANNKITVPDASGKYCVRYMYNNDIASKMVISSNFIPKTLSVILESNLYSGGSCDIETSTLAGKVIIKVPRFQLNGSQELSMTASGVSQTAIEGTALSSSCTGCNGDGVYAEILQVMENRTAASAFSSIVVEDAERTVAAGAVISPVVYACPVDAAPIKLAADQWKATADTEATARWTYVDGSGVITIASTATSNFEIPITAFDGAQSTKMKITIG